jgi:uncharacterized protein DUF6055/cellulose binding protein with CBM2 domain
MSRRMSRPMPTRTRVLIVIAAALGLVVPLALATPAPEALAQTKTVYIPARWQQTGEVPWVPERTRESRDFILLWGDLSGTNPLNAPSQYRFDPDNVLSQLESLYSFYINQMQFTTETGLLAQHKIIVIITRTWTNKPNLEAWATGGSVDGRVGIINIAPAAAAPGSWGLAHELGHVFQNYTFLGQPGQGFTHPSAGTFWETSAEFMAMQVYPNGGAGDLTRFIRTENLRWDSSRHHYGSWMLMQYIKERHGIAMFNRIWNEATSTEHPLEVYRRLAGINQAELNRRIGEYAMRNVTWDYANRANIMPFINQLFRFVTVYNGVSPDPVNAAAGHWRIPDALAPGQYGYNKIRLVPTSGSTQVRMRFRGHVNSAAQSGWTFGFVAIGSNGTPRYGPLTSSSDATVSFQLQAGEQQVYLVVTGTPGTIHKNAFLEGFPRNWRFPYQFRLQGAVPYGFEPGHVKPTPTGGRWHSNGGGWVDSRANVAATAYVGPRAAVYGNSTVNGNARIEGLSWVNSGATVGGNVVVRDSALVQGGSNLSGSMIVGGDAEPAWACGAGGTYMMFVPDRQCDGRSNVPGEADINPAYTLFTDAQMTIDGTTDPTPSPTPSASPSPSPSTSPPPGPGGCSASYTVVGQWGGGFQAEVKVTAGGSAINGWRVTWTFANGQTISQFWGAKVTGTSDVTAENEAWNGALAPGGSATFGFIASAPGANNPPALACTPR